ncbi:MAG: CAP domain-containing protein [Sandaracinaceae bacterium]|nr:CAP domain-containing protein [Sandaracinaceae bacterium]
MSVLPPESPPLHGTIGRVWTSPRQMGGVVALALSFLSAPLHVGAQRQQAPAPIEGSRPAPAAPARPAPAAPAVAATATPDSEAGEEGAILDAINMLRAAESLGPLVSHAGLMQAARGHSAEMAQAQALAHVSPTTGSPADRASAAGVRALRVTQNISRRPSAMAAHEAILASEAHRAQLLDPNATHIGVGLAQGTDGIYLTELMARLVPEPALPPPSVADVPQPPPATPALVEPEPAQPDEYYPPEPAPQVASVPPPPQAQAQQAYAQQPQPQAQTTGTLPTLRLTRAHRGVAGYWLFHEGRWWYFPVPAGTRTGQLVYPDTTVQGSPPGYQGTPPAAATQVPTRVQPTPTTAPRGYWRLTPQ